MDANNKALRDFAAELGISIRQLQKHVQRMESDLEGHIVRYGPPRGTFIDEAGQAIIREKIIPRAAVVLDDTRIRALEQENMDLMRQLVTMTEALRVSEAALAEVRLALAERTNEAERQVQELREQLEEEKHKGFLQRIREKIIGK